MPQVTLVERFSESILLSSASVGVPSPPSSASVIENKKYYILILFSFLHINLRGLEQYVSCVFYSIAEKKKENIVCMTQISDSLPAKLIIFPVFLQWMSCEWMLCFYNISVCLLSSFLKTWICNWKLWRKQRIMKGLSFLLFVLALKGLLLGKFFKQKTFDISIYICEDYI